MPPESRNPVPPAPLPPALGTRPDGPETSRDGEVAILAPLRGWVSALSETPDPVFAEGVMGEGVAIDPTSGEVRAPFDGTVVTLPDTAHAVGLRHATGLEVLVHVGIDTVGLRGSGFEACVAVGDEVREGDLLIRFDLDAVARRAPSLVSPVVVMNGEAFQVVARTLDRVLVAGDPLMRVRSRGRAAAPTDGGARPLSREVTIGLAEGVHARPAAALARILRDHGVRGRIQGRIEGADLRSTASVMALALKPGDRVEIELQGEGAAAAMAAVSAVLAGAAETVPAAPPPAPSDGVIRGATGAPGLAVGPAFRIAAADRPVAREGGPPDAEARLLETALDAALAAIRARPATGPLAQVLEAHAALLEDPVLRHAARAEVTAGASAAWAWRSAIRDVVGMFERAGDARLAERVADLRDVERQVLRQLPGADAAPVTRPPPGAILIAEDLTPSELADHLTDGLAGVCLARSGPTAHVAIIAASMGLPLLTAAGPEVLTLPEGRWLILDADRGELVADPDADQLTAARDRMARREGLARAAGAAATAPARTLDGETLSVFANLGRVSDAAQAVRAGAEGCGLLRTEFLFMDREVPPSEEDQRAAYQQVMDGLEGRPLVIRTLDAGGDKPIAYLPRGPEANPALGLRGIRASLARPDLLRTQLRAAARVTPQACVSVMLPMVTGLEELATVRDLLAQTAAELGRDAPPALGVMVETPASVLLAADLAREADFLSIGTNDLAQYVLAMDRTEAELAVASDALHPAVLRAIALTLDGAAAAGCPVSVCGGLASDPVAVPILVGMGVRRLSCTPGSLARIKALIRTLDAGQCATLARQAQGLASARAVRSLVRETLPDLDA